MNDNNKNEEVNAAIQDMMTKEAMDRLVSLDAECRESSAYESDIDDLDCSAKVKRVLRELSGKTAQVGGRVVRVGKIALDFALKTAREVYRRFPNASCAVILVLVLKAVLMCIPFFGWILAPLLEPLFLIVLVGIGICKDVLDMVIPIVASHYRVSPAEAR